MQTWGGGYVTDIEYAEGFYPAQSPQQMALAATINAIEAPDVEGAFAYCELGCGRGGTTLVLAALNPEAEFHAIDFHPAHIAHARAQAKAARLDNVTFHELSFADLGAPGAPALPMFDAVSMHGVWSWISPELQTAVLGFLAKRVKPGGMVQLSFNALPGWADVAPVQRIVKELALALPGRSDRQVGQAIETLGRLEAAKVVPDRFASAIKTLRETAAGGDLIYLAHEYLNDHWRPLYHADVARSLAGAKLDYAASSDLLKNFHNIVLTAEQRELIAEVPVVELRETLKDFCTDEKFRQDVYVRGPRRMTAARREALLKSLTLTLTRHPGPALQIKRPDGSFLRPDPAAYGAFLAALSERPHRVDELLGLPQLPHGHAVGAVELAGVLVGTGLCTPWREPSAAARAAADRLNGVVDAETALNQGATIAAAHTGLGVALNPLHFALYDELRQGLAPDPEALAARFVKRCRDGGGHPVIDGKPVEDDGEALAALTKDYAERIELVAPIWRMMGIV